MNAARTMYIPRLIHLAKHLNPLRNLKNILVDLSILF